MKYHSKLHWTFSAATQLSAFLLGSVLASVACGNASAADLLPPAGTVSINGGSIRTNNTTVTLSLSATDADSGVAKLQVSAANSWANVAWEDYEPTRSWTLTGSDGVKYVYVRFKDAAGNISSVKSDSIILDTKPPALTQSAATKTPTQNNSKTVSGSKEAGSRLTLSIPEGAPFTATLTATDAGSSWSCLLDGLTEGTNSITLIATDAAGNGTNLPVEVIRDTAKPAGTLLVKGTNADDSMTKSTAVTLALTADGTGSNPAYMRFSNNGTTWSSWEAYKPARTWTLPTGNGEKNVYAMVKDSAGNESDPFSDSIVLDATAPKGAVSINDGATWSKSGDVALRLTATDVGSSVVKMQINSVNSWTNVSWEDYAPTRDWTLAGTDGKKYVYARFMDAAGNISTAVMDSIVVDTVLPALAVTSPVTLQTVLDSRSFKGTKGAGATLSVSASTGATVTPVLNSPAATSWTYAISNFEEGENVITFTAADAAGNEKQVAVTVTFTPFKTSDMAGTWHLNGVSSGGTLEGNLSGTLTLDEFGTVTGGTYVNSVGQGPFTAGALAVNAAGAVSGFAVAGEVDTVRIEQGTMDASKNRIIFSATSDLGERQFFTATKAGGAFSPSDLEGNWILFGATGGAFPTSDSAMTGLMQFDAAGKVLGGILMHLTGNSFTLDGGTMGLDESGYFVGPADIQTSTVDAMVQFDKVKLTPDKTMFLSGETAALLNPLFVESGMIIAIKGGGSFVTSDIAGTWHFAGVTAGGETSGETAVHGTMTVNSAGTITGGRYETVDGGTSRITGGKLTLNSSGIVAGSIVTDTKGSLTIIQGKLSPSKSQLALAGKHTVPARNSDLLMAVKLD